MAPRGKFIVFEGGEGSGKSTQARLLAASLDADLTREPGGTTIGEELRSLLLTPRGDALGDRTELLMMVAGRAQHVSERIAPTLERGCHVVCDRFSGSTLAYQGYGRGLSHEVVLAACTLAEAGLTPDLTILLDVPIELAQLRRCGIPDRIEGEDNNFHTRVVEGFRSIASANPDQWAIVDGTGTEDEVSRRIAEVLSVRVPALATALSTPGPPR